MSSIGKLFYDKNLCFMCLYFRLTVYDLLSEGSYLVDLTLSTCLDADVSVFQTDSL